MLPPIALPPRRHYFLLLMPFMLPLAILSHATIADFRHFAIAAAFSLYSRR